MHHKFINRIGQHEFKILDWIYSHRKPKLNKFMRFTTHLGTGGILWFTWVLILYFFNQQRTSFVITLSLIVNFIFVNAGLKLYINRERPYKLRERLKLSPRMTLIAKPLESGSFPSGHTSASAAASLVLLLMQGNIQGSIAFTLAILIGISRLYFYVHFPSDVILGFFIGILSGFLAIQIVYLLDKNLPIYDLTHTQHQVETFLVIFQKHSFEKLFMTKHWLVIL